MQQIPSKCKFCDFKTNGDIDRYARHIENKHKDLMIPDMDGYQFIYYLMTGKTHGTCIVCKKDTTWNPTSLKYNRYCNNPECKKKYREMFKNRMINTHGKVSLLDEPDMQKKMLANRRISGVYTWPDGSKTTYTGSYEKAFLQLLDSLNWDPNDVMAPSPHTYEYIFQGKSHFYIPDFYIPSLNCEIEIKDGGDNPNMHHKVLEVDKVKEALKDHTMRNNNDVDYIKIVNKSTMTFLEYLMRSKERTFSGKNYPINICDDVIKTLPKDAIIRNESGYYIHPDHNVKILFESSDDITISKNIAREFNGHTYYPMYILLSATSTPVNRGVRKFLNEPYGHSSISFDNSMNNLYTFGYKKITKSFGMTGESIEKVAMRTTYEPTASYGLYVIFLNEEQIKIATAMTKSIFDKGDDYKYSVKGLVNIAMKNPTFDTDQFFCSWFVAHILSCTRHDIITKHPSLYTPYDLSKIRGVYFVDGGLIKDYNRWKVESITAKILNKLIKDKNTMALESFNDLPLAESVSKIDPNFKDKRHLNLSSFKVVKIDKPFLDKYKDKYSHLLDGVNPTSEKESSIAWLDNSGGIVAGVSVLYPDPNKPESYKHGNLIRCLEIYDDYRGHGLSEQVLDYAVKKMKGNSLYVMTDNEVAIKVYKDYGFKITPAGKTPVKYGKGSFYQMTLDGLEPTSVK